MIGMSNDQRVGITLDYQQQGLEKVNASVKQFNDNIAKQQLAFNGLTSKEKFNEKQKQVLLASNYKYNDVMNMGQESFKRFNQQGFKFNTIGGKTANWLRKTTHGLRGFRMEMLGIMFFGMAVNRVFMGLMKTSMEWVGITEVMSSALGILFLPIALVMLDWALLFLEAIGNLTDAQKLWIGRIVLFGAILGGVVMIIGTLALGIGSLILAFGSLVTPVGLVLVALLALAGFWIIPQLFDKMGNSSDKLKTKLTAFGMSSDTYDIMASKIVSWYNTIKDYFEVKTPLVLEYLKIKFKEFVTWISEQSDTWSVAGSKISSALIDGMKTFFTNNPMLIVGAIVGGIYGGPVGSAIGAAIGAGLSKTDFSKIQQVTDKGLQILTGLLDGIVANSDNIGKALETVITAMGTWIGQNSDKLFDLGITIADAIARGILKGLWNALLGIAEKTVPYEQNSAGNIVPKGMYSQPTNPITSQIYNPSPQVSYIPQVNVPTTPQYVPPTTWKPIPVGDILKNLPGFDTGGIVPGPLGSPMPILAHGGETVVPYNKPSGDIILNVTYNVNVSDKREFDNMIKSNNIKLVDDVRRMINN